MPNVISWFEIPVADLARAKHFYQQILDTSFKDEDMGPYQMAIFASDEGSSSGSLMFGEHYQPSQTGAVVYLYAGDDLSIALAKIVQHGGQVLLPKTPIHEGECGYFALFLDSEGNRVGLYSQS